jgi:hypothetical protein
MFVLMNVVHREGSTCQFPLKHLLEVILVVLVAEVKLALAIHEAINVKVFLDV